MKLIVSVKLIFLLDAFGKQSFGKQSFGNIIRNLMVHWCNFGLVSCHKWETDAFSHNLEPILPSFVYLHFSIFAAKLQCFKHIVKIVINSEQTS